ncbi:MAG TPA: tRNA 2-thiouridine(34) synthase MnmA [Thermoanaerobaculia bacterium]|nr:tRNA 2-thiouridine(34) synthase MnmA [Thermoanaerobaculia bacterium]
MSATRPAVRTAVAMSGGLDSSVVAHLLATGGEEVIGLSMLLWEGTDEPAAATGSGRCCGALDLGDARRVAEQIGIPHYTLRMDEEFRRQVVDPFVDDYLAGRTPSPCVRCNTWVKFDLLLARARRFGAERLATGHYARLVDGPAGRELHTARVPDKDQSYFLFELDQEQLAASRFPLGELSKDEVRELARAAGLVVAEKGESMETCFVADDVASFVARQARRRTSTAGESAAAAADEGRDDRPAVAVEALDRPATVVDPEGRELGQGAPYYRYTVGQRRGLGVSGVGERAGERLYVLSIDPAANRVTAGGAGELASRGLIGSRLHWINPDLDLAAADADRAGVEATIKLRSRHAGARGVVRPLPGGTAEVTFAEPQTAVAPGQAAVFYRDGRVLGGCWIERGLT